VVITIFKPSLWRELFQSSGLILLAFASGVTNVSFNWAVTVGDVVRVVLLFYLMPAWALLLARWLLKERITTKGLFRLSLAVVGVLLVLKKPDATWPVPSSLPDYLALMGGFSFALTNVLLCKLDHTTASARLFAMFVGGSIIALGAAFLGVTAQVVPALPAFSWVLALSLMGMAVAFYFGNVALQYGAARLKSSTTSLVMLSEIIFASLSAVWMGGAVLDARVLWGAFLIFSAALWAALA